VKVEMVEVMLRRLIGEYSEGGMVGVSQWSRKKPLHGNVGMGGWRAVTCFARIEV
jgi:hypothetical protein